MPPIIASEHGDVSVFRSLRDAEAYVEPVDVENGEYEFYDAEGSVLKGEVYTVRHRGGRLRRLLHPPYEAVRIVVLAGTARRPDELAAVLHGYLERVGAARTGIEDQQLHRMTLDELLTATADFLSL